MPSSHNPEEQPKSVDERQQEAVKNVTEAHRHLDALRSEIKHPDLDAAILKLELALDYLTIKSGGML
jgi:hypothetical protein